MAKAATKIRLKTGCQKKDLHETNYQISFILILTNYPPQEGVMMKFAAKAKKPAAKKPAAKKPAKKKKK